MKLLSVLIFTLSFLWLPNLAAAESCIAGQYMSNGSCRPAEMGHYVPNAGATAQIKCAPGTYSPALYRQKCELCPKGEYQPQSGRPNCQWTTPGNITPTEGTAEQIPCPKGSYSESTHAYSCKSCDRNYTTSSTGSRRSSDCKLIIYQSLNDFYAANGDSHPAPGTDKKKAYKCKEGRNWNKSKQACK